MIDNQYSCVAEALLQTNCIGISVDRPYTLTSGDTSPVYVDCRKILSLVDVRQMVCDELTAKARDLIKKHNINIIAGGETAGIPYGAIIADRLKMPMVYIRKKPKAFGHGKQIEGEMPNNTRALLVEDLMSLGSSKKVFLDALTTAGAVVPALAVVFSYNLFDVTAAFNPHELPEIASVATWHDIYEYTKSERSLFPTHADFLAKLIENPQQYIRKQ